MGNDNSVKRCGKVFLLANERKVRESPLVVVPHMHAAVKHDALPTNGYQNAASADILTTQHTYQHTKASVPSAPPFRSAARAYPALRPAALR